MVELQIINKILQEQSLAFIKQNNIDDRYFVTYKDEFNFIIQHHAEYGTVPDKETFFSKEQFKDTDNIDVKESERYLIETIQEQFMYNQMVPFVHKLADVVTEDSEKAVEFMLGEVDKIKNLASEYKKGFDIVQNSDDRRNEFKFRLEAEGLLGITTGLKELDEITHGWLKEDFIVILGRTNEGKSWVLLFFLVSAWLAGIPVLLYSGEMSETIVGFRFDSLVGHFSNNALMSGEEELGTDDEPKSSDDYFEHLNDLSTNEVPFVVVTPKHIKGERLTIPVLHQLIEMYKPGLVGIDQLSLMNDYRRERGDQVRTQYTHIAEDLYLTSEKYGIPILAPVQANRDAKKDKKGSSDEAPEIEHISESDGVGQNATRVLSIKKIGVTMKLSMKKNRYGEKFKEVMTIWDMDKGIIRPFLQTKTNENEDVQEAEQLDGEDLF